jgi:uncharacterized membrane-anchored protein YitT (DUF2179 family)
VNAAKATSYKKNLVDTLADLAGSFLMAIGTQVFSAPNGIAPGGVTGLSVLLNYLTGLPISAVSFIINIPILVASWCILGRKYTLRTMRSVVAFTLMLEVVGSFLPIYQGEAILAALYGGVLSGCGLSLIFMRGSTTGGTDILARLLQKRFRSLSVGRLLLVLNGSVLLLAAAVYQNIENALYAMISIFASSRLLDSALYGMDMGKVLMIITEKHEEAAREINSRMGRGCTLLEGKGTYTQKNRPVLLCAVRRSQVFEVKSIVFHVDPAAFIVAMEANEIIGNGFKAAGQST